MFSRFVRIAGLSALALSFLGSASARTPAVALGRTLAIQSCSACHEVTETQAPPAAVFNPDSLEHVGAPSFVQISRKYGKNTKALRAFIRTPEHPMPEQRFLPHDLDTIIVYIRSLDTSR